MVPIIKVAYTCQYYSIWFVGGFHISFFSSNISFVPISNTIINFKPTTKATVNVWRISIVVTWYLTNPRKIKDATKTRISNINNTKATWNVEIDAKFFIFFVNFAANSKTNLDSLRSETDYATNLLIIVVTFFYKKYYYNYLFWYFTKLTLSRSSMKGLNHNC